MSKITNQTKTPLETYYKQIHTVILSRQNPITGLLPASTAVNAHGDYTDAWVRDNVYSILAVWALALAYRKIDAFDQRTFELEHSTIKLMRGLLYSMMRQADKVEKFKRTQSPLDALHAKYDTKTGDTVVGDDQWGHLQLDATSIFVLMLAQMTASGLTIIYSQDEVNFIQNLVYYISRTYRTPDYGIWERGNKINHGDPELNASSIGMAKAALEAINGLNLFGVRGGPASTIHVLPDEIAHCRITLESLLPRESSSKEVDAAILSIIGFPAFAIADQELVDRTRKTIIDKLQGRYGCKRFLRDGHQTVLEDTSRLHYEPWELKQFEHIECEWPLFFTYLYLDGLFRQDAKQIAEYRDRLEFVLVEQNGWGLLPELYYVPEEAIEAERQNPHSQTRKPNENIPLVWAQSLYLVGQLLDNGWIALGDIDPLGRHRQPHYLKGQRQQPVVQIALLAEDEELQGKLATYGIATQTPAQLAPMQVRQARELATVYKEIGLNKKLGLTGRPMRRLRSLMTSRIFRICGEVMVFLPAFLDQQEFYQTLDYHFLVAYIKSELAYIDRHWRGLGRPTMTLLLTHTMLEPSGANSEILPPLLELMQEFREGECGDVKVKLGSLNEFMLTSAIERIDFLREVKFPQAPVRNAESLLVRGCSQKGYLWNKPEKNIALSNTQEFCLECETNLKLLIAKLKESENLYEQVELLHILTRLEGLDFDTGIGGPGEPVRVRTLLDQVYAQASQLRLWAVVRYAAGLLNKVDISLSDAVTDILVRQKQITVGRAYSSGSLINRPMSQQKIMQKIREFCREDIRDRALTQEILIYLSTLIKSDPKLLKGFVTLRVGYLILLLVSELALELNLTQDEAYEALMKLSPFEIKTRLRQVLEEYAGMNQVLQRQESIALRKQAKEIDWVVLSGEKKEPEKPKEGWRRKRQLDGSLNRMTPDFYPRVWKLMQHCKGLVIGDKLERRNRLDSELILSEMTQGEKNFDLKVEHLLNKIDAPEYRQLNVEALIELSNICDRNPELQIEQYLVLDVIIGHAVRQGWLEKYPERADKYDEDKQKAWDKFYDTSPYVCAGYIVKAFRFLTEVGEDLTAA